MTWKAPLDKKYIILIMMIKPNDFYWLRVSTFELNILHLWGSRWRFFTNIKIINQAKNSTDWTFKTGLSRKPFRIHVEPHYYKETMLFSKQPLRVLQPGAGEVGWVSLLQLHQTSRWRALPPPHPTPPPNKSMTINEAAQGECSRWCARALFQLKIKALKLKFCNLCTY